MIAMVVGDQMRAGPVPIALGHAGFEARDTRSPDEAESDVEKHGELECVLVLDAELLAGSESAAEWRAFLDAHAALPAVVVACGGPAPGLSRREPHRELVEDPFDAAAVVAAAGRASRPRRPPMRRVPVPLQRAG